MRMADRGAFRKRARGLFGGVIMLGAAGPAGGVLKNTRSKSGPVFSPTGAACNDGIDPGRAGRRRRFRRRGGAVPANSEVS